MENSSPARRHRFAWPALALFGGLILMPCTRMLLRMQLQMEVLTYATKPDHAAERRTAARLSNDYPVQLAVATQDLSSTLSDAAIADDPRAASKARNRRIAALAQRFPNNPSVYANLLRYLTFGEMHLARDPPSTLARTDASAVVYHPSAEALALFLDAAHHGAQLDPDNAYFSVMEAVGLFASYRDSDGLEALKRAARCSQWREYFLDELEGWNRLQSATYGDRGGLQRLRNASDLCLPQYASVRSATRVGMFLALTAERTGNREEGIAIRHAVMRWGGLLRAHGEATITTFVGLSMVEAATSAPGGLSLAVHQSRMDAKQRSVENRDRYCAYLESLGRQEEVHWAKTEFDADDRTRALSAGSWDYSATDYRTLNQFCFSWLANSVLLACALILLLLSGAAKLATLVRPRQMLPLWQCAYALLLPGGIGLWQWKANWLVITPFVGFPNELFATPSHVTDSLACCSDAHDLVFGLSLLIPLLLVGIVAILSFSEDVLLPIGMGRGMRGLALPAAMGMLLLYGVSLLPTAHLDAVVTRQAFLYSHNEARCFAETTHKAWPGGPQP